MARVGHRKAHRKTAVRNTSQKRAPGKGSRSSGGKSRRLSSSSITSLEVIVILKLLEWRRGSAMEEKKKVSSMGSAHFSFLHGSAAVFRG